MPKHSQMCSRNMGYGDWHYRYGNFFQVFPRLNCADYFEQLRADIKPSASSLACVSRFPVSLGEAWFVDKRDKSRNTQTLLHT